MGDPTLSQFFKIFKMIITTRRHSFEHVRKSVPEFIRKTMSLCDVSKMRRSFSFNKKKIELETTTCIDFQPCGSVNIDIYKGGDGCSIMFY